MKHIDFEHIAPHHLKVGDILMCFAHDDQWERRATRVVAIESIEGAGVLRLPHNGTMSYDYRLFLHCRHVSLKRLDATGGPLYTWHRFSWNITARYIL